MNYGCLFSGVGCSTLAFAALGWACAFHAETDAFAAAVLRHHWPAVRNLGDVTAVDWSQWRGKVDLMMGSPPCQDFSVAGKRAGMGGARGNLSMIWAEVVNATDPLWSITENVPGWLTSRDNAFGAFLGALVGGGGLEPPGGKWRAAGAVVGPARSATWRVLDAQYFGVPQRRRRVFVVSGRAGSGADPVAVLFERAHVCGHPAQSGAQRQEVAGSLGGGSGQRGWCDDLDVVVAFDPVQATHPENRSRFDSDVCHALARDNAARAAITTARPRRLTPTECERLQGMPDGHTLIPYRGKPAADGPRYRAIGNGIAVPVLRWIAQRIEAVQR